MTATQPDGSPLGALGAGVRNAVWSAPWAAERERLHAQLGPERWSGHWRATGAGLWESTRMLVDRVRAGIVEELGADRKEEARVRLLLLDAALGQHDAAWLCAFEPGDDSPLAGLAAVARDAGWWWPYEKTVVLSERPLTLHRDEAGRLDRGDGPALGYADGFELYAWRGMPVPKDFLDDLTALTPERIRDEENAELRRVMLEFYGYDRYLEESGAVPVHRDETGVLWRVQLVGDEDVVMVEVVNSTPEPDGSSRTYWLRCRRRPVRPVREWPGRSVSRRRCTSLCDRRERGQCCDHPDEGGRHGRGSGMISEPEMAGSSVESTPVRWWAASTRSPVGNSGRGGRGSGRWEGRSWRRSSGQRRCSCTEGAIERRI